jgi:chlorite dismutase
MDLITNKDFLKNRSAVFYAGDEGEWRIKSVNAIIGNGLSQPLRISKTNGATEYSNAEWSLAGVASNERYVIADEKAKLQSKQEGLGRKEAVCAALIPITKSNEWWSMPQDQRRKIFEEQSHHTSSGLKYLPAIARKLYHCRDIGGEFDFLTWFEFAPEYERQFDELVYLLRKTEEWKYVTREVDIRLQRAIKNGE